MQIQPIAAIRPLRIRPKQIDAVTPARDQQHPSENSFQTPDMARHAASQSETAYHGAQSEYSAQLLANRLSSSQTEMDRTAHLAQYGTANRTQPTATRLSVSV